MHALRRRCSDDGGFVVVLALVAIALMVVLAGSLVTAAVVTSSHGNKDYAQKRALAAANAGLQAAIYRLSSQAEDNSTEQTECFTTAYVKEGSEGCPAQEDELVKNIKYKYYVSPNLNKETNNCTGLWLTVPKEKESTLGVTQRCVTSVGTANGATARVQARVADAVTITTSGSTSVFPVNGVYSFTSLEFTNKIKVSGAIGARTKLESNQEIENPSALTAYYGESIKLNKCKIKCTETKLTGEQTGKAPYALPTQEAAPYSASVISNNNASLKFTNGEYNSAKREPVVKGGTLTIPEGTYNFCEINWNNELTVAYKGTVKIYVDSPNRTGSGCTGTNGTVQMTNKVNFVDENATKKAADLQIYVWGNPKVTPPGPGSPIFKFNNNIGGPMYAQIYAPYSAVEITNNIKLVGAIAAGWAKFTNEVEMTGESAGSGTESGTTTTTANSNFYTTAYHQCSSTYTSATTGCY